MKMNILKKFSNFIINMEQNKKSLIKTTNDSIRITKHGYKLLNYRDRIGLKSNKIQGYHIQNTKNLEFWTEEELEKYQKKHSK